MLIIYESLGLAPNLTMKYFTAKAFYAAMELDVPTNRNFFLLMLTETMVGNKISTLLFSNWSSFVLYDIMISVYSSVL